MIKKIVKLSAAVGISLGLMSGVALADSSITDTGAFSHNKIKNKSINICKDINKNKVAVANANFQNAKTGKAKVVLNTTGGNATSGDATNTNSTNVGVGITNTNSCCGCVQNESLQGGTNSIDNTGAFSHNSISNLDVNKTISVNENNVLVGNLNVQSATSGDATVLFNTTGGDATSGNAMNTNNTEVTVTVQ